MNLGTRDLILPSCGSKSRLRTGYFGGEIGIASLGDPCCALGKSLNLGAFLFPRILGGWIQSGPERSFVFKEQSCGWYEILLGKTERN